MQDISGSLTLTLLDTGGGNADLLITLPDGSIDSKPSVIRKGYDTTVEQRMASQTEAAARATVKAEMETHMAKLSRCIVKLQIMDEMTAANGFYVPPPPTPKI